MKISFASKLASFIECLWLFYFKVFEDSCSKLSLTKKADMSKVNSKFPNCFQSVQLFLSMSSCLPSFVLKGLRGGGGGGNQE